MADDQQKEEHHVVEDLHIELTIPHMTMDELMKSDLNHVIKSRLLGSIVKGQLQPRAVAGGGSSPNGFAKVTFWKSNSHTRNR